MHFELWALVVGGLLIAMVLGGTLLQRLPLSTGILYLAAGAALGPAGIELMSPDPHRHSELLERATEVAVLISLFAIGLKLGLPFSDARWHLSVRLATVSMVVTVVLVAAIAHYALQLPLGAAVLLGAILAPTDPVLASDVQLLNADDRDRLRFSLSAEGGLNDGTAFPFVMLGLGLLGLHELGAWGWRWLVVDVAWAVFAGLAVGSACGAAIGRLVVYLRTRHSLSVGLDEFLGLGLIALAYGLAVISHGYGFLAVLAAGVALQRVQQGDLARPDERRVAARMAGTADAAEAVATDKETAATYMTREVQQFNEQLERIAELAIVIVVGAMLYYVDFQLSWLWLVLLLLLVVRPVAVWAGLLGAPVVSRDQRRLISWFGIRGIGSIYYLVYALNRGVPEGLAETLLGLTLTMVAVSVILHGISVTPLMGWYARRRDGAESRGAGSAESKSN
jgi:NhaP-type Na+/H+ or K+/H+ antiporter